MGIVYSVDILITSAVVFEVSIINVLVVDENVIVLVSVNDVGVIISMLVVIAGDKCTDELAVLSISRGRIVDVIEFIVVPVSIVD